MTSGPFELSSRSSPITSSPPSSLLRSFDMSVEYSPDRCSQTSRFLNGASGRPLIISSCSSPNASSPSAFRSFDISAEGPLDIVITPDQIDRCSQALKFLKEKLRIPDKIRREFQFLQTNSISSLRNRNSVALDKVNMSKNRYSDVLPFDNNRVILNASNDYRPEATGYINASFISTSDSENVSNFIATQGPLPETYEDFWEMVIQYRCPVIVMLTRLVDKGRMSKCGDYFNITEGAREFGNIIIITKWTRTTDTSLLLRHLEVNYKESKHPPRSVLHIQYPDWPDHGVPGNTKTVSEIFRRIFNVPRNLGPIVVHCSAGIGRTGTYCMIHDTIQRIVDGDMSALDLISTLTIFRSQRMGMVQTLDQFIFCYRAVINELEDMILRSTGHQNDDSD